MNRTLRVLILLAVLALLVGLETSSTSLAAPIGGAYSINAWSVSGGGGSVQAGSYSLTTILGQAEAGRAASRGVYTSNGGFLPSPPSAIYLPMIRH
jgi:hypothetical protein